MLPYVYGSLGFRRDKWMGSLVEEVNCTCFGCLSNRSVWFPPVVPSECIGKVRIRIATILRSWLQSASQPDTSKLGFVMKRAIDPIP